MFYYYTINVVEHNNTMLRTRWLYMLKKEELTAYLSEWKMNPVYTVEELRKRSAKFLTMYHDEEEREMLLNLQSKHELQAQPSVSSRFSTG